LVVGCWLLVVGCWLLVVGYWLLVIGYWLLVVGCWLLVIGRGNPAPTHRLPIAYSKAAHCPLDADY